MDLETTETTPSHQSQEDENIDPKELYEYLLTVEPKDNQTYLEILASLTMTPSPIDNPEENLLTLYTKNLKTLLMKDNSSFMP